MSDINIVTDRKLRDDAVFDGPIGELALELGEAVGATSQAVYRFHRQVGGDVDFLHAFERHLDAFMSQLFDAIDLTPEQYRACGWPDTIE